MVYGTVLASPLEVRSEKPVLRASNADRIQDTKCLSSDLQVEVMSACPFVIGLVTKAGVILGVNVSILIGPCSVGILRPGPFRLVNIDLQGYF